MPKARFACLALPLILSAASVCSFAQSTVDTAGFAKFYERAVERYRVAGSSIAIVDGSGVIFRKMTGEANRRTHQPVDDATTFHWASITKTFTGIAIMQLRDRGLLQLDDPIVKYVPELRAVHDPFGPVDAITIRELMMHTAGFRGATWPWSTGADWEPFEPAKWSQVVAMLPYTQIEFQPGTRHSYSNLGIVFLGQVIERLSGDDYEVYIDKNILKPLGMSRSYFDRAPYFLLKNRAAGYTMEHGVLREEPFNFDSGITVSNGGLNAPVPDMIRYLEFLIDGGEQREIYPEVLKRSSLEEMFQKRMPIKETDASQTPSGEGSDGVGLSFFQHEAHGVMYVGHGGEQGGFVSHLWFDPRAKHGYIVVFNMDSGEKDTNTHALDRELRDELLGRVFPALARSGH